MTGGLWDWKAGMMMPFTIVSTLLIGIWLKQACIFPWFRTYSMITIGVNLLDVAHVEAHVVLLRVQVKEDLPRFAVAQPHPSPNPH